MNNQFYVGQNAISFEKLEALPPVSKIVLFYDDDNAFEAGDDTGYTMEMFCPSATQEMADNILDAAKGYVYQGFKAEGAELDPEAELGDGVTIAGIYSMLAYRSVEFSPGYYSDISAPLESEVEHEYPYIGSTQREMNRKVTLGKSYYGTKITRKNGLEITKTNADGSTGSRAILNSDVFALYDDDGTEALYFDTNAGKFKFSGILNVADNFIVDASGNVTINGNINMSTGVITWGENNPRPEYLHDTYIGPTTIEAPLIEANEFNVQPSDPEDYTGAFNIYGKQGSGIFHMLGIEYQGYSTGDVAPYVNICSPGGAYLRFNYGDVSPYGVEFYGATKFFDDVDFTEANVVGIKVRFGP